MFPVWGLGRRGAGRYRLLPPRVSRGGRRGAGERVPPGALAENKEPGGRGQRAAPAGRGGGRAAAPRGACGGRPPRPSLLFAAAAAMLWPLRVPAPGGRGALAALGSERAPGASGTLPGFPPLGVSVPVLAVPLREPCSEVLYAS